MDASGREHLLLNFYVHASPAASERLATFGDDGPVRKVMRRVTDNAWTWDELHDWARRTKQALEDRTRSLFLYLTGENGSGSSGAKYPYDTGDVAPSHSSLDRRETQIGKVSGEGSGLWSTVTGLFSGLGRNVAAPTGSSSSGSRAEIYDEGEVHCDLIKVCVLSSSRVGIPNLTAVE